MPMTALCDAAALCHGATTVRVAAHETSGGKLLAVWIAQSACSCSRMRNSWQSRSRHVQQCVPHNQPTSCMSCFYDPHSQQLDTPSPQRCSEACADDAEEPRIREVLPALPVLAGRLIQASVSRSVFTLSIGNNAKLEEVLGALTRCPRGEMPGRLGNPQGEPSGRLTDRVVLRPSMALPIEVFLASKFWE